MKFLFCLLVTVFFATAAVAQAQLPKKVPRIGYVSLRSGPGDNDLAFRQRLRELGYVEGQNIVIEWRFAEGKSERYPLVAAELVQLELKQL
jgi:putative tryptophan/tyrosine transport system substrate-binding protein